METLRDRLRAITNEARQKAITTIDGTESAEDYAQRVSWARDLVREALVKAESEARNGISYVLVAWPSHFRDIQALKEEIEHAGFTAFIRNSKHPEHVDVFLVW